jgi:hypothetical protein
MAVSEGTLEGILGRYPTLRALPRAEVPLGGEPQDFARVSASRRPNRYFDPADGDIHLVYVGTLLPLGLDVLRALFDGARLMRERDPDRGAKLRFHFFGTSNQTTGSPSRRVLSAAVEAGMSDVVEEHPLRIDYVEALAVQAQAQAILLLGSTEPHYTASKIYPALLSGRPLVAIYHEASSVCQVLRRYGPRDATFLTTFTGTVGRLNVREAVAAGLSALTERQGIPPSGALRTDLGPWEASALAERVADCLAAAAAHGSAGAGNRG